jgi:cytokinin dehydrogenase
VAPGEELLRATGEWFHPHPWLNVLLPDSAVERLVAGATHGLTRADLGNSGLILLYPVNTVHLRTPRVRRPAGDIAWLFAILRTADPGVPGLADTMIAANRAIHDTAIAAGATTYPVNTFAVTDQ